MNSNWFKLVMKMTKVEYGKNLLLKGVPIIFNKGGAKLKIGGNVTIKSSFLSNLVGLYSRIIIVTRAPGAEIEIGDNVGISGATIYARKKITIGENTCSKLYTPLRGEQQATVDFGRLRWHDLP